MPMWTPIWHKQTASTANGSKVVVHQAANLPKRKLIVLALVLLLCQGAFAKTYLVSVGIADYPGRRNDLGLCAEDAKAVTWVYGKNSGIAQSKQLIDRQATVAAILGAMESTFSKAGPNDRCVFFFSGHGYEDGFVAYDGFLSYDMVRAAMRKGKAQTKMIFADACYSGGIRTPRKDKTSPERDSGVMLFLSSRTDEVSLEVEGMKNGVFTAFLQKALRGSADRNRDRKVTAKELYDYVHDAVVRSTHGGQHPVMWGKFRDDMAVITW